jgi:hypothetical protein
MHHLRGFILSLGGLAALLALQGCETTPSTGAAPAILTATEESAPSNLGPVKVKLRFSGVDGRNLLSSPFTSFGDTKVTPGRHHLEIRVFRAPATWNNGRGMYGRTLLEVTLESGHIYQVTGRYDDSYLGRYAIKNATTGEIVTTFVDMEFSLVEAKTPLLIPILIK